MSIVNWDNEDGEIRHCVLQKDENGYGLQITGGNPVTVKHVSEGGAADREGVRVGDKIIKVNGTFVANSSHQEVVDLIKASNRVSLIVTSSCRSSPPPLPPLPQTLPLTSTLKRNGSMIRGKRSSNHRTTTSVTKDLAVRRESADGSLTNLALQRSSSSAAIFDSRMWCSNSLNLCSSNNSGDKLRALSKSQHNLSYSSCSSPPRSSSLSSSLSNSSNCSSGAATIFAMYQKKCSNRRNDSRRKRQGRRKSVYASSDEAVASLREEAKVICQKMNDMAMRELKIAQARLKEEPSAENQIAASQAFVKLERLRSGEAAEDLHLVATTPPGTNMMELGNAISLNNACDVSSLTPENADSPVLLRLHVDNKAIKDENLEDSVKSNNNDCSILDSTQLNSDASTQSLPIVRLEEVSSDDSAKNKIEAVQIPVKTTMTFNLQMAVRDFLPSSPEVDLMSTPTREGSFHLDSIPSITLTSKQELFKDFATIRQYPVRLGLVINYLLKKGEKDHSKYLLFHVIVEHFKHSVCKSDVNQVTRRWVAEIYTSFLTSSSPLFLKVPAYALEPLTERLSLVANESTEKPNWSALFDAILFSLMEFFELAVREFRVIFNTGLSQISGVHAVLPNMNAEATAHLLEPFFVKLLRKLTPKEEAVRADNYDADIIFCQALRTAMAFWNIPIRDASLQSRTMETTISNHGLFERIMFRSSLTFNATEEVRGGGGHEKQRRSMLGSALFSGGKSKAEKLEKKKARDGVQWRCHLFSDTRIESLQYCHVCEKLLFGLPPQGWHCQYCSLIIHFECKEALNEECVNSKKDSTGSVNFGGFAGTPVSYLSKRRMKLSTSKDAEFQEAQSETDYVHQRSHSFNKPRPASYRSKSSVIPPVLQYASLFKKRSISPPNLRQEQRKHSTSIPSLVSSIFSTVSIVITTSSTPQQSEDDDEDNSVLQSKDPTPSSVSLEEPVPAASPLDELDSRLSAAATATIAPGYVMNMRNQFESGVNPHLNNEAAGTAAKSGDFGEKERLTTKSELLNRTNSLRDGAAPSGSTVMIQPRPNSDTPQHSNEIAEARRETDLATTTLSVASYSDKSLASAPSMDNVISGSSSTLHSLTDSLSPSTFINEEDLNNDEDLRLPSGLDEYKQRYDVDTKLMNMNKDLRDYQYHLHEIIATEMGHVRSLKILQVLYARRWPPGEQEFKMKIGLQHIEPILQVHRNLMQKLEQEVLKNQYLEKNFIITDIFRVLLEWYSVPENVMQFKRYGASFGSKQGDVSGQKVKNRPDSNYAEIEDYIKKNARNRTPFWKFLDQSDRHALMEKRRFQDVINIECQRQMRLVLLVSQAHSKLKKVKDKLLIGKQEAANLKEVEKITRSVTTYLDQEVTWLKDYAKMDLSRYEPLDHHGVFSRENIIFNLHIMYLHREADVRVTSLHAPTKGRRKEQNMKLLWLEDNILFIVKDESTGLCLKSIEASSTENPEQNIKANPIIQLRHVVTGSCSQPPEMKLFWYQPTAQDSENDAILLAVSIVFEKAQLAVEFKDAFAKAPKAPIPRKSVGRSQSTAQLPHLRHSADRSSSDVSGMFSISKSPSSSDISLVVDATAATAAVKEEEKIDDDMVEVRHSEETMEYIDKAAARDSITACSQTLKDGFFEQSVALSRVLRMGQLSDLEQITDLLLAQSEPLQDVQDVLLVAHRQTAQISSHLSSAVLAAGDASSNALLCSSLRKLRRQVLRLQGLLQTSKLGMESDGDEESTSGGSSTELLAFDYCASTPKAPDADVEDPNAQDVGCAPPVDEEIPAFNRGKYFTTRNSVPPLLSSTEELEEDAEQTEQQEEVQNRLLFSQSDLDHESALTQSESHNSNQLAITANSDEDGNCTNCAADADYVHDSDSSVEEENSSISSIHSGSSCSSSSVVELGETELWEHLVCEIDSRTLNHKLNDVALPPLENLATTCDEPVLLLGCDGVNP